MQSTSALEFKSICNDIRLIEEIPKHKRKIKLLIIKRDYIAFN